jgi:diaminopimelate epimerase
VGRIAFAKVHGLGNDFILIDRRREGAPADPALAVRWCDRHHGVGADGVLTLLPPRRPEAAVRMHIYNADGSSPEMCGNGLRCVVRHVLEQKAPPRSERGLVVDTDAGLRRGWLLEDRRVRVTLGRPVLDDHPLSVELDGVGRFEGLRVSMGNPHFVLRPEPSEPLTARARRIGPLLERHPAFPDRTNVEFIAAKDGGLEVVVFERGSGFTLACGTGAAAAAVAARAFGLVPAGPLRVQLPGGPLEIDLDENLDPNGDGGDLTITGEAVHVFDGTIEG